MTWHASTELIDGYLDDRLDSARAASLEQHVLTCGTCRRSLAEATPTDDLDLLWADVIDAVDRPRPLVVERVLGWVGVRPHVARLLAATPSLRISWLAGLVVTLVLAVLQSQVAEAHGGTPALFLVIAPLLPLVSIAAAYGPGLDPAFEVTRSASYPGSRLFLQRSSAVLVTSIGLGLIASAFLPLGGWDAMLWLLPALAASSLTLALSTWIAPLRAAVIVATVWVVGVSVNAAATRTDSGDLLDRLVVFRPAGQVTVVVVMAMAATAFVLRLDRFDTPSAHLSDLTDLGA